MIPYMSIYQRFNRNACSVHKTSNKWTLRGAPLFDDLCTSNTERAGNRDSLGKEAVMRTQGLKLDRWLDKNRKFVVEAFRAIPVVNLPCEGGCGRIVQRSCRKDQVMCGGCDFAMRCKKAAEAARALNPNLALPAPPAKPSSRPRPSVRLPRRNFSWMRVA
jgi:hypothetical protein